MGVEDGDDGGWRDKARGVSEGGAQEGRTKRVIQQEDEEET